MKTYCVSYYRYFFITPLFKNLTAASTSAETSGEKQGNNGYIIVETNYRVYAYTDSSLQLAILSTFTEMLHRYMINYFLNLFSYLLLTLSELSAKRVKSVGFKAAC